MRKLLNILTVSLTLLLLSCSTTIKKEHWDHCESLCNDHKGVLEACHEFRYGKSCHCADDSVFWFDKGWEVKPDGQDSSYSSGDY